MRTRTAPSAQELTLLMYMRHEFLMFIPRTSHFDVTNTGRTRSVLGGGQCAYAGPHMIYVYTLQTSHV